MPAVLRLAGAMVSAVGPGQMRCFQPRGELEQFALHGWRQLGNSCTWLAASGPEVSACSRAVPLRAPAIWLRGSNAVFAELLSHCNLAARQWCSDCRAAEPKCPLSHTPTELHLHTPTMCHTSMWAPVILLSFLALYGKACGYGTMRTRTAQGQWPVCKQVLSADTLLGVRCLH